MFEILMLVIVGGAVACYPRPRLFPLGSRLLVIGFITYIHFGTVLMSIEEGYAGLPEFPFFQTLVRGCTAALVLSYLVVHWCMRNYSPATWRGSAMNSRPQVMAYLLLGTMATTVVVTYFATLQRVPFVVMFQDPAALGKAREMATTSNPIYGLVSNCLDYFLPFSALLLIFFRRRVAGYFFLSVYAIAPILTGQKSSMAYALLLGVVAHSVWTGRFRAVLWGSLGALILLGLMTLGYLQNFHLLGGLSWAGVEGIIHGTIGRLFIAGPDAFLAHVRYFPAHAPHFGLDFPDRPVDQIVHAFMNVSAPGVGTLNSAFPALIYASVGGYFGVWAIVLIVGFVFTFVDRFWLQKLDRPVAAACYAFFCLSGLKMCITDAITVLRPLFLTLMFVIGLGYLSRIFSSVALGVSFRIRRRELVVFIVSLLAFAYVVQGQTRMTFKTLLVGDSTR